jgi:subtilisin family serine protease
MSRLLKRFFLVCGIALLTWPLAAQSYVLEVTSAANIAALASKYGFTIVKSFQSSAGSSYSISTVQPLSQLALTQLLTETGVRQVDTDSEVDSPESESGSKAQAQLESLGNLLSNPVGVDYYGSQVLATYVTQPGTQLIELAAAHTTFGAGGGTVAIIDTGVDPNHPALSGALVPGYDFTRDRPDTVSELNDLAPAVAAALNQSTVELLDAKNIVVGLSQSTVEILDQSTVEILDGNGLPSAFGHGTMVAGLVHLVAPNAKIMPLKAFHADGSASLYDIDRAIRYATDNGANVISMSFSFPTSSPVLQAATDYAHSHGVITIASAGNDGKGIAVYPAASPQVIGVGSTNFSDKRSPFSNYGPSAKTSAPGEALVTLFPGGNYAAVWGTSFSAALVSGAVAMMKTVYAHGTLSYSFLRDAFDSGAQIDQDMGDGRLDLVKSLTYCLHPDD